MFSDPDIEMFRTRAVDRSLESARARSLDRYERLVCAARDLADEHQSAAFTVQDVAARAESSLKGFYRCFAGKDDLLVALLAEDSRLGAEILSARVRAEVSHAARFRACVTALFEVAALPGAAGYARVLVSEHRRLSQERTQDLRAALSPLVAVITRVLADAAADGAARSDDPERDAETVFSLVLEGIHDVSIGRAEPADQAEYLWRFCRNALGVRDLTATPSSDQESS